MIVALDQMSLYFQATTTRVWSPCGQTPVLRTAPQRDHVTFYGALNLQTGHEIALTLPEQSSAMTCHFLTHLLDCYPSQAIFLLWDRAPWHTSRVVQDFIATQPRLHTCHFPPGCPQLNPQEHVWERTRDCISHNHHYRLFPDLVRDFRRHLDCSLFLFEWLDHFVPPYLFEVVL